MDPRDLEDLGNADEAEADPESSSEVSYDDGDMDMHEDEGVHNESDALKALEEHAEHEAKFGHVKLKEIHEIDTSAALEKVMHVEEATFAIEHLGENLGEDFEATRWSCPTIRRATTFKYEHVYKHAEAKPSNVKLTNSVDDLGVGCALYFQLVYSLCVALGIMTLCSIPSLLLFHAGNGVPYDQRDALGLYQFSLGNLGASAPIDALAAAPFNSSMPSSMPTSMPTWNVTRWPYPTGQPTLNPTGQPTGVPTGQPTGVPTGQPTSMPSNSTSTNTTAPTSMPSGLPTSMPTGEPTGTPTTEPTGEPTSLPTRVPFAIPDMYEAYGLAKDGIITVSLPGMDDQEISVVSASAVLMVMEVLQCVVFLAALYHINRMIKKWARRKELGERAEVTLGDFTVVVRDLPPDTTIAELIEHFSVKWGLAGPDWKGRPPLYEAEVVKHADSSGQTETIGTWVAEVTIHRRIGHLLRGFRLKQRLMEKLYRHRAEMKMYADDTPNGMGPNKSKYLASEKKMLAVGKEVDKLTKSIAKEMRRRNFKIRPKPKKNKKAVGEERKVVPAEEEFTNIEKGSGVGEENKQPDDGGSSQAASESASTKASTAGSDSDNSSSDSSDSDSDSSDDGDRQSQGSDPVQLEEPEDPREQIEQLDAVAAFVVFNYSESMARCVEDYRQYSGAMYSYSYPDKLLFKGEKIRVEKSPEPFEVNFENLEIPASEKLKFQARSNLVIALIFIFGLLVLLIGATYQSAVMSALPSEEACTTHFPNLFTQHGFSGSGEEVSFVRPDATVQALTGFSDAACQEHAGPGSVFAWYSTGPDTPVGIGLNYSTLVCDSSAGFSHTGMCPQYNQTRFCPCISTQDTGGSCPTVECQGSLDSDRKGCNTELRSGDLGKCYCAQLLLDVASGEQPFQDVQSDITGICSEFYGQYILGQVLSYLTVLAVTLANMLTRRCIPYLAKHEYHDSRDEEQTAIMLKTFTSMFLNLSFAALLAYTKWPNGMSGESVKSGVGSGGYGDFDPAWYASVGSNYIIIFLLESFVTVIGENYDYYVTKKCLRCCNYAHIEGQNSHKVAMQHDLDAWEVGPYFSPTLNTAKLLAFVFFTMMFAPGLPLMTIICFLTFLVYFRCNKYLLLRYYMMPDATGDGVIKQAVNVLPWAVILRCMFAIWMFSNPLILPVEEPFEQEFDDDQARFYSRQPGYLRGSNDDDTIDESATLSSFLTSCGEWSPDDSRDLPLGCRLVRFAKEDALAYVWTRIWRDNVAGITVFFLVVLTYRILRDWWEQLPLYWTLQVLGCIMHTLCGKPKAVYVDNFGYIRGWDLLLLEDELRQEMCPYTGGYYYLLRDKKQEPEGCCAEKPPTEEDIELEDGELKEGWQLIDLWDQYRARAKIFQKPTSVNGVPRPLGDMKRTYEIIAETNLNSYRMEGIPAHKLTLVGLQDGTGQRMTYQAHLREATHKHKPASAFDMLVALAKREHIVDHYKKNKTVISKKKKVKKDIWKSNVHHDDDLHDAYREKNSDDEFSDDEHAGSPFAQRHADEDYDPDYTGDNLDLEWS